jgi:hypothetical protein
MRDEGGNMANAHDLERLHKLIDVVGSQLGQDEKIVQIRQGQTRYGRQTYVYYLVDIATLEMNTGNEPSKRRSLVVEFNVDSPDSPRIELPLWVPYDHVYS